MDEKLRTIITSMVRMDGSRLEVKGFSEFIPDINRKPLCCQTVMYKLQQINKSFKNLYFSFICDGQIQNYLSYNRFQFNEVEKIIKVLDVFCKSKNAKYAFINDDIINLDLNESIFENKDSYWIAVTKKGSAILENFVKLNGEDNLEMNILVPTVKFKNKILEYIEPTEHKVILAIKTSGIRKFNFELDTTPEKIEQIYSDIEPIVSKFFLRDFSLDNIYYDMNKKKYIIAGITDYLLYKPNIITIDLGLLFSQNSLYVFKETKNALNFEEFLIYMFGFEDIKSWWELC